MNAIVLGVVGALAWGLHDLLIRFVSRAVSNLQAVLICQVFGALALIAVILFRGDSFLPPSGMIWPTTVSAISYTFAYVFLFLALASGPIALVAPIIGAYPGLAVGWAALNGATLTALDIASVAAIIAGVALVSRFAAAESGETSDHENTTRGRAILFAFLSGLGFGVSLISGQAAIHDGGQLAVTFASRIWGMLIVAPLVWREGKSFTGAWDWLPTLAVIGVLDVVALTAIISAGQLEGGHFAIVVGSCFSAVTVLLAVVVLKEKLTLPQTMGMIAILFGISQLAGRY